MSYIFSYLKAGFDIFQKENKICNFRLKFVGKIKQKLVTPYCTVLLKVVLNVNKQPLYNFSFIQELSSPSSTVDDITLFIYVNANSKGIS